MNESIWSLVRAVTDGGLGGPTVQRPPTASDVPPWLLAESLYRGYPIGCFTTWTPPMNCDVRRACAPGTSPVNWLVDGRQRASDLCLLYGTLPYWHAVAGRQINIKIQFNPITEKFRSVDAVTRATRTTSRAQGEADPSVWIDTATVMNAKEAVLDSLIGVDITNGADAVWHLYELSRVGSQEVTIDACSMPQHHLPEAIARLGLRCPIATR